MLSLVMRSDEIAPLVVVVDMQRYYDYRKQTLQAVERLLSEAVSRGAPVVFLEQVDSGDTDCLLLDVVAGYPHYERVSKQGQDGAAEVLEVAVRRGFTVEHIYVCGVYTDQCVAATTRSLSERLPDSRIVVHKEACEGRAERSVSWSWMMFPARRHNVELREWYPYNREPEFNSLHQNTMKSGRLHLELCGEQVACEQIAKEIGEFKREARRRSDLEREYIERLCLWAETSLLRARQFIQQSDCLRRDVTYYAVDEKDGPGFTIDGAPHLTIACMTKDPTDLLQIALDDIEHARLALLRCQDYIVMARQVLDK
jgi:nicotinamidase-related amidase